MDLEKRFLVSDSLFSNIMVKCLKHFLIAFLKKCHCDKYVQVSVIQIETWVSRVVMCTSHLTENAEVSWPQVEALSGTPISK